MALAIEATSNSNGSSSPLTWSHTCAGSERLLVVGVAMNPGSSGSVSGVTYNGAALTPAGLAIGDASDDEVSFWNLIAPATGTNNIIVTVSGSVSGMVAGAVSFTGAHQTVPLGGLVTNSASSDPFASVTASSEAGGIVVDMVSWTLGETASAGSGQTSHVNASGGGSVLGAGSTKAGAASVLMSWSLSNAVHWCIAALPIKASGGGGGGNVPQACLLGVG